MERAKIYFRANDVPEDKQAVVFLSELGDKTYSVLRNLTAPDLPQSKTFEEIVTVLESHYEPKPIVIAQRFHFHRRNQLPTENIVQYMAELRRLSTHSSFGPYLNEALRDRLVCGLRSDNIQKRLLSVKDLTLKVALDTALSMEAADSTASALHGRDAQVNILHKNKRKFTRQREHQFQKPKEFQPCYRCGKNNHMPTQCRFISAICNKCGKRGHIAPACKTKPEFRRQSHPNKKNSIQAHYVEQELQEETEHEESTSENELHLLRYLENAGVILSSVL